MSARSILESSVDLILNKIKTDISSALSATRADRGDGLVTTEAPVSYFIYDHAIGYKAPAVFVLMISNEFLQERGQNHINCRQEIAVSCMVEDRNQTLLTRKCFRYHDALHLVLDRAQLVTDDNKIKIFVKVVRSDISETSEMKTSIDSVFRKEVMLTLEVEHIEQE